ncbi:MAG: neutral/alkaline non-lysosomal ceramidase N-terminal domain-containing protein [Armatimonadota bacterium]|nr:neutral/alkaline non-lysosomal ceramidase N-terminal domain-containing protein [Armatimonadota bacterium]MDW8143691.1 neutral/alkaline non-lysosomal ceramidase N-terminal domain-containing protein [Armatimonadota bacterium]
MRTVRGLSVMLLMILTTTRVTAGLYCGAAKHDITPDVKARAIPLGGYGERMGKPATGVHDNIFARAIVISDGKQKVAIVSTDLLFISEPLRQAVLQKIAETGIGDDSLFLTATHSHSAPEAMAMNKRNIFQNPRIGIFDQWLFDFTVDGIATAIIQANRNLRPAKIGWASKPVKDLHRNRRGDEVTDDELFVLRVDSLDGKPIAAIVNYAAHPTILSARCMEISGDWCGWLEREMEKALGDNAVVLFLNGAQGDQSPKPPSGETEFERVEQMGKAMIDHALHLHRQVKFKTDVKLEAKIIRANLPKKVAHPQFEEIAGREYGVPKEMLTPMLHQLFPDYALVMAVRIGDVVFIGIPGEPIAQIGLNIKAAAREKGIAMPIVVGLANDYIGYILTADEYRQGGYEATVSFYGEALGKVIEEIALSAIP